MNRVLHAEPHRYGAMGSFGKAAYMLIRQHKFPDTYSERDVLCSADHDRVLSWHGHENWRQVHDRHPGIGLGLDAIGVRDGDPEKVLAFLVDLLQAERQYPDAKWTGFRVLGTVNRSNGYPVWSLEVFAKVDAKTRTYTGETAPNVKRDLAEMDDGLHWSRGVW